MEKKYLHIAIVDDFNECFVSFSEEDLRIQVSKWLLLNSISLPTDAEWALTLGEDRYDVDLTTPAAEWIFYYKIESKL
jgi:hypothetical protein